MKGETHHDASLWVHCRCLPRMLTIPRGSQQDHITAACRADDANIYLLQVRRAEWWWEVNPQTITWTSAANGQHPPQGIPCVVWCGGMPRTAVWRDDMGFASVEIGKRTTKFSAIDGVRSYFTIPDMPATETKPLMPGRVFNTGIH